MSTTDVTGIGKQPSSSKQPSLTKTVPTRHPDAPLPNVIPLHPNGVTIRNDSPRHWIGKRIDGRPVSETSYDMGELLELRELLNRYIAGFEEP